MKNIILLFGILSLTFLLACSNNSSANAEQSDNTTTDVKPASGELDYQALADAYCKCSEPTVAINNQMEALIHTDGDAFEKLVPKADKAFKDAIACCKDAKAKQTTGKIDNKILIKPLKQTCPDLPGQLVLKLVTEIE